MSVKIVVPVLGESITEAIVAQWLKQPGEAVAVDEPLVELETDKVTLEVPSPSAGVLGELAAQEGDTVEVGALLAIVSEGAATQAAPTKAEDAKTVNGDVESNSPEHLSPAVAKLIAENDLDSSSIAGTGKDGRILKGDVLAAIEAGPKPATKPISSPVSTAPKQTPRAQPSADQAGREERVRMSRLRLRIAERLKEAQNTAAMLTTYNEVDMSAVMSLRKDYRDAFEKRHGVRLGFMSFFVKAAIAALKEIPQVNAEIEGTDIVFKNYYNVGVAVGTENGLVVPVLKDADLMGFSDVEKTINDFGRRARDGKLGLDDMTGGTFTISNGGVYGSLMSSPILNPPQSGILGMHKIQDRPIAVNGEVVIRPMMYLALSYDHRIVDGREAVTFLVKIKEAIEDPTRLVLEV
ncbi:2-oxoglutarate dehydrogenase complex dihydrolipoyllysine-residue succinyltransferase [Alphaproteobacteria bacterium]|nr:2-oxoglutarate dehydrogenase complex dihydrolipoyllysine-residue succinyltransferase [Alphaproteobacteria bacterium]